MLAAAEEWQALSGQYETTATELTYLLAASQTDIWQGASGTQYASSHTPYLAWLTEQSITSASNATLLDAAATAYVTTLAMMPTLAELAANHATHAVLTATNFFGINTIPIALNEADYVRMWIQAATTMATYQTETTLALESVIPTSAAPTIMSPTGEANRAVADITSQAGSAQAKESSDSLDDADSSSGNIFQDIGQKFVDNFTNSLNAFVANPSPEALLSLIVNGVALALWESTNIPIYLAMFSPLLLGLGLIGLTGLEQLGPAGPDADQSVQPAPGNEPGHRAQRSETLPLATTSAMTILSGPPAPTAPAPASPVGAATPAVSAVPLYAVHAAYEEPPDRRFGPTLDDGTEIKAPAAGIPAATVVAASARRRARRKRRAQITDPARQFMDIEESAPSGTESPEHKSARTAMVSERATGQLGFAGAVRQTANATGLIGQFAKEVQGAGNARDEYTAPVTPLLPKTWNAES